MTWSRREVSAKVWKTRWEANMSEAFDFHRYGTPREVMCDVFSYLGELPIKGGWGYTKDDAVIIDKNDPVVEPGILFNGVALEYTFIEHRNYLELITFRPEGDRYAGIEYKRKRQELHSDQEKGLKYDRILYEITCFHAGDYEALKREWETVMRTNDKTFDIAEHMKKREALMVRFEREAWFEISSFYGQY